MPAPVQSILLVADPDDSSEILEILASAGHFEVVAGDGSEETLVIYEQILPDLVILCAGLELGDAHALASAMRDAPDGRAAKIVLIGERDGPIRNALDASHFPVDRFLAQPLSPKALIFVVHDCLRSATRERPAGHAVAASADLEQKMELAMNQAIDEFVRDAMEALPVARRPRATLVGPAPPPEPTSAASAPATPSSASHGQSSDAPSGPDMQDTADILAAQADAPPAPKGGIPLLELVDAASLASEARRPAGGLPARAVHEPAVPAVDEDAATIIRTPDRGVSVPAQGASEPRGGAFARELRRKMTVMAERLFPGQHADAQVDIGPSRNHAEEIDLTALGMDAQSGRTQAGADSHDDGFHNLAPTTLFVRAAPDETGGERDPAGPGSAAASPVAAFGGDAADAEDDELVTVPRIRVASQRAQAPVTESARAVQQLADAGPIQRGRSEVAIIIEQMYRRRFTGRVSFGQEEADKEILFDSGRPVFASSSLAHDRMGELLFREGKINAEQLERVKAIVAESGRRMGEVLIDLGWLKRRELLPVVRRHIEDIVYSLFAWESGTYRVMAGKFAAKERIRISRHPAAMLLEGVRRKLDLESLTALVGTPESVIEIIDDHRLKSVMSVADLSLAERKVIAGFDGERTIAEVQTSASLELVEVYQLAYGLMVWGAARPLRRGEDTGAVAADDTVAAGETSPGGANDLAIDRQRVMAKYSLVTEADYFTLLGVRRDATSFEIRRAYETARRDYAREGFAPELLRELGREIADIDELLEEAYRVLRDDNLRASYLANLYDQE